MSKTLKQRMETELNSNLYLCHDFNEIEKEFLRLAHEWLLQKQQEYIKKQDITKYDLFPQTYQWIESRVKFIYELLGELV
jgi:hypothetical protein